MKPIVEIPVKRKIEPETLFKISRMKEVIKPSKPHRHDQYYELIYLTAGKGFHYIDTERYEVHPNTIYFIRPGQVHCWEFTEIPKGFVIIFRDDFILKTLQSVNAGEFLDIGNFIVLQRNEWTKTVDILENIESEYNRRMDDTEIIISAYLQILFTRLRRFSRESRTPITNIHHTIFAEFKNILETNYRSIRQVKDYAARLNISPKYLNELSVEVIHKSASTLIKDRLLLEAKRMLLHSTKTISEIAYSLNFNDPSHFVKFFRKEEKCTPNEFRKRLRR